MDRRKRRLNDGRVPIRVTEHHPVIAAIFREMQRRDLTNKEVALAAGVNPNLFANWKCGERTPNLGSLLAIYKVLGLQLMAKRGYPSAFDVPEAAE